MDICCASFSCVRSICCGTTATNRSTRQGDHFVPGPRNREDKKGRRARCCARSGSTAAARVGTWHSWSRRVRLRIRSSYGSFSQRSLVFVQTVPRSERPGGARGWQRGRRGEGGGRRRSGAHARVSSTTVSGGPVCPRAEQPSVPPWCSTNRARGVRKNTCAGSMSGFQAHSGRHFTGTHGRSILPVH